MTIKNPNQFHPKYIPLQIQSLGTRDVFCRLHTNIIVDSFVFLIQLKKR